MNFTSPVRGKGSLLRYCMTSLPTCCHGLRPRLNDVANAVGPLAAIVRTAGTGEGKTPSSLVPGWVLLIGGVGYCYR